MFVLVDFSYKYILMFIENENGSKMLLFLFLEIILQK